MKDTFLNVAAEQAWTPETQVSVLLEFVTQRCKEEDFRRFLEEQQAFENADPPVISAECYSDDHVVEVKFDAVNWFLQAQDQEIIDLGRSGWGYDYPSDEVGRWFSGTRTKLVFDYLAIMQRARKNIGFTCVIDEDEALSWLEANRPAVAAELTEID